MIEYLLVFFCFFTFLLIISLLKIELLTTISKENLLKKEKLRELRNLDLTFDKIQKYYIDFNKEKSNLQKEFDYYDVENYQKIEACEYSNIENIHFDNFGDLKFTNEYKKIDKQDLARTCSHLKAIKKAYDDENEIAVIMEDDLDLSLMSHWRKPLKDILEDIPDTFEVLLLSFEDNSWVLNKEKRIYKRDNNDIKGSNCYIISKRGMEKIVKNFFKDDNIFLTKDLDLKNITINSGVWDFMETYYIYPQLFLIKDFEKGKYVFKNSYKNSQILKLYTENMIM